MPTSVPLFGRRDDDDGHVPSTRPNRDDVAEAAAALRRVLDAIDKGELEVTTPQDIALVRRLQGLWQPWRRWAVDSGGAQARQPEESRTPQVVVQPSP